MKALTLHQPWASLIALGRKTIETRSWATKYRGPIAIHAGKAVPGWVLPLNLGGFEIDKDSPPGTSPAYLLRGPIAWPYRLPLGAIVATAVLVDCVPIVDDPAGRNCVDTRSARQPDLSAALRLDDQDGVEQITGLGDQVALGDYTPGRWAWLLDDIKPTTERCPVCWGDGGFQEDSMILYGIPGGSDWANPCPTCNPAGRRTEPLGVGAYGCDPIPAKGKQCLWEWTP